MPKSGNRKKRHRNSQNLPLKSVRLSETSILPNGMELSAAALKEVAEWWLTDACERVINGEHLSVEASAISSDGRFITFVDGPLDGSTRLKRRSDHDVIQTKGSVMDNLDVVEKVVRLRGLVALVVASEAWLTVNPGPEDLYALSRTESFGRRDAVVVNAVSPALDFAVSHIAPIVNTPFGRLASPQGPQNFVTEEFHSNLHTCFEYRPAA